MLRKSMVYLMLFSSIFQKTYAFNIVLDPGHGGNVPGCVYTYDNKKILEKDLNYKIAKYIKEKLEKDYLDSKGKKIKVYFTHKENQSASLKSRVEVGVKRKSAAVISLHCNASTNRNVRGPSVLVTSSNFNKLYETEEHLAKCFLDEFKKIGLNTSKSNSKSGILRRLSDDGTIYNNGDTTDWYGIVMHGIFKKIPSIIVEHAYLSNESDYREYLSTDKQLKKLADADTLAIARHFNLTLKSKKHK